MAYARTHVKQALMAAREAGKPVDGLIAGDRETVITLENWGFLPIDQAAVDKRIQDWYVSQGLAVREGNVGAARRWNAADDTPNDTPDDTPTVVDRRLPTSSVAIEAAEAALAAATAALRLAKSMAT